ncbi:uncharacterized protein LOC123499569 [Portunus trituberculatus]|uniref:uncharacterized protein LOC123499569 n=1 Tax=Portunus trituberculatus TaxID=210409 RepID=UPI001E1D0BE2|nr:uncharacterized protein LOC123499569 [Portunus trituberculatus]
MEWCRKKHWPILVAGIMSWACAISLTISGMYIIFTHSHGREVKKGWVHRDVQVTQQGWRTAGNGMTMIIGGCVFNGILLTLILVCLRKGLRQQRRQRMKLQHRQVKVMESPPDYDTAIKEDMPPSYSSLNLASTTTAASSTSISTSTSISSYSSPSPSSSPPFSFATYDLSPLLNAQRVTSV